MPITAELHDGTRLEFPDGTDPAVIQRTVKNVMGAKTEAPKPAVVGLGETIRDIPRQVGLTARAGVRALATIPAMGADAVAGIYNTAANALVGDGNGYRFPPQMQALDNALTQVGLPAPRNATERVAGQGAEMMAGAGGLAKGAEVLARGATGVGRNVLQMMAANPVTQIAGGTGAGVAGGSVRESGGSPLEEFGASLAGGVGAGMAANKLAGIAESGTRAVRNLMTPRTEQIRNADQTITLTLQRAGIDWAAVPDNIKAALRGEVADALSSGQPLSQDALRRLVAFRRTGTTPTVGQLTQDPGQITREMNLAKTGANSTDPVLQRLPGLQNENASRLLAQLDGMGADPMRAPSGMVAGQRAIDRLGSNLTTAQNEVDRLYTLARDSSGRSVQLDGATAMRTANENLRRDLVGKLGGEVDDIMNRITSGETPLTVDYQQQLSKMLYRKIRGAGDNGDLRHGLGLLRQAIDNAEPVAAQPVAGARLLTGPPGAPVANAGDEAIQAFRTARTAHRELRARIESNPALRAVDEGVEPDKFVQRYLIGDGATAADVRALVSELDPQTLGVLRSTLAKNLRDAATTSTDDVVKFSNTAYRKTFRNLEAKLPSFFNADEIDQLRAIGDAAKYMQAQPVGSAVNNSNSGALVLGRGLDLLDRLSKFAPLGAKDVIQGKLQGVQQTRVLDPRNALMQLAAPVKRPVPVNPLLAAAVATPVEGRENKRGN